MAMTLKPRLAITMGGARIAPTEESSNESIQHGGGDGGFL